MHLFFLLNYKTKEKVKINPTTSSAPLALIVLTLTQITVTLRGRNVLYGRACLCRLLLLVLTYALCFNYCASVITTAERCVNICMGRDVWWPKLSAWISSSKLMWVDRWIIGNFTRHLIADLTTPRHHITWKVGKTFTLLCKSEVALLSLFSHLSHNICDLCIKSGNPEQIHVMGYCRNVLW